MIQSMTQGNPIKLILLFSIPIMLGNFFQQLYILSDLYILGHFLGLSALAVAGAMTPVFMMALFIATGFTNGLCIITAQRFGANDIRGVRKSFSGGLMLTVLCCFMVVICIQFNLDLILQKMNVPTDIYVDSGRFLKVITYAALAMLFYNYLAGVMRALGDSKTPLYFLIFASVLNIIINVTLIGYYKLDVVGVAVGTGLAQGISVILCCIWLFWKFPILRLRKSDWSVSGRFLLEHLKVAIPMSLQFSVIGLGVIVVQSICNKFGTDTIAAFSAAGRIEHIATVPLFSLGIGLATYTAQNFGACLIRRIRQGVLQCFIFVSGIGLIMTFCAYEWGSELVAFFLSNPNQDVLNKATQYVQVTSLFYFFLGLIFVFRQALQGMGYPLLPLLSGLVELGMRGFAAFYLASLYGYIGICYAGPIAWIGGACIVVIGYLVIIHRYRVPLFGKIDQKCAIPRRDKILEKD